MVMANGRFPGYGGGVLEEKKHKCMCSLSAGNDFRFRVGLPSSGYNEHRANEIYGPF